MRTVNIRLKKVIELEKIAKEINCSISEMAIAWCLLNKNVSTVITGASKPEQVKTNMNSLNIVELLDNEILEKIETILDNKPEHDFDWRNN